MLFAFNNISFTYIYRCPCHVSTLKDVKNSGLPYGDLSSEISSRVRELERHEKLWGSMV